MYMVGLVLCLLMRLYRRRVYMSSRLCYVSRFYSTLDSFRLPYGRNKHLNFFILGSIDVAEHGPLRLEVPNGEL